MVVCVSIYLDSNEGVKGWSRTKRPDVATPASLRFFFGCFRIYEGKLIKAAVEKNKHCLPDSR